MDTKKDGMVSVKKKGGKGERVKIILILAVTVVLAAALIITAVLLRSAKSKYEIDLVAEIELSNGKVLAYELYYDYAPIAVSNFVYRANNGYYTGSVFYPVKTYPTGTIAGNILISGIYRGYSFENNKLIKDPLSADKFNYEIKKDDAPAEDTANRNSQKNQVGSLFTWRDDKTSKKVEGGFGIYLSEYRTPGDFNDNYSAQSVVFGAPCSEETRAYLAELSDVEIDGKGIPTDSEYRLTITRVRIFAKDKKWKKYDFKKEWEQGKDYYLTA